MSNKFKIMSVFVCMLLFAAFFVAVNAVSDSIEVKIDPLLISVRSANKLDATVTVTNNQNYEDTFDLAIRGGCSSWGELASDTVTVPAGSSKSVTMTVTAPSKSLRDSCDVEVTASSNKDVNKWNYDDVTIFVQDAVQTGKEHFQENPEEDQLGSPLNIGQKYVDTDRYGDGDHAIASDFVFNPKLQTRGYTLNDNGDVCVGDTLSLSDESILGEWYQKGGPQDSPPVQFVDDLNAVKDQIRAGTYKTNVDRVTICSWREEKSDLDGPPKCVVDAAMICDAKCTIDVSGPVEKLSDTEFKVTTLSEEKVNLDADCPGECILFIDREEGIYYPSDNDARPAPLPKLYGMMTVTAPGTLSSSTILTTVEGVRSPELKVADAKYPPFVFTGQPINIVIPIQNDGDMLAHVDSIKLNMPNYEIVDSPGTIAAGENREILIKTDTAKVSELKLEVEYRADKLGCLQTKEFKQTYSLGPIDVVSSKVCATDGDCAGLGTSPTCCNRLCQDAALGTCDDIDGNGVFEWSYY